MNRQPIHRRLKVFWMILLLPWAGLCHAATDAAQPDFIPWSGYWWPTGEGGLSTGLGYRGHPAPIEKYELLKNGSYPGLATQWDLEYNYDPEALSWAGLCAAYASAAAYERITFYPSSHDNIVFYVGDKKGLITACHDNDVSIRVNAETPDIFHYWLLHYIKEQGIAFYAELDPSEQVWNYPITRYQMGITEGNGLLHVTCQIWYADDMVDPDIQGTVERTKIYTYDLIQSGNEIIGGEWTGYSEYDHPQQLVLPVSQGTRNPYLDYTFIRTIALSRDDELESDQAAELPPGRYTLILLNEDRYTIPCDEGDTLLIHLQREDAMEEGIRVVLYDAAQGVVYSDLLQGEKDIVLQALTPPYTLSLSRDEYGGGGVYHLAFDVKKAFEFANTKIQKGFGWGGFAITNAGETTCDRIYVVGYGRDGLPTETYLGPFSLAPGQKRTAVVSDFEVRVLDRDEFTAIKILAPRELQVINLFGYFASNMSGYGHREGRSRFVIPDTSTWWDFSRTVSWGLYNPGLEDKRVVMDLFSPEGERMDSVSLTLPANRAVHYGASDSPFAASEDGGWIVAQNEGEPLLQGYTEWLENGIKKAEALGALEIGRSFFVPQVAHTPSWDQRITLMNVSDGINPVTLTLVDGEILGTLEVPLAGHEKRAVNIADLFSSLSSAVLNRSALVVEAGEDLAGFVTYRTPNDDVFCPLMTLEDVSQILVLPHVASNEYWWTGVALFNPFDEEVHVRILPYGENGQPMEQEGVDRYLGGQKKGIYTMKDLFGNGSEEISFVTFQVVSGPGIGGFFSIGNYDCSMLSGAVMR